MSDSTTPPAPPDTSAGVGSADVLFRRLASIKRPPPWASSRGFEWAEKLTDDDLQELADLVDRISSKQPNTAVRVGEPVHSRAGSQNKSGEE